MWSLDLAVPRSGTYFHPPSYLFHQDAKAIIQMLNPKYDEKHVHISYCTLTWHTVLYTFIYDSLDIQIQEGKRVSEKWILNKRIY